MTISQTQIDHFHRDGYLLLDFTMAEDLLDAAIEGVAPLYEQSDTGASQRHGTRVQDAWRVEPHVRRIALDGRVMQALQALFGRRPRPFQTLNFPVGTEQKVHADTIHFNSRPAGYMAGVWVALEDIDTDNGALIYYPGSHRLPEITMRDVGAPPLPQHYADYENHIQSMLSEQSLTAARGVMRKGQIFIWHANLLHGGGPHPDKQRSRHSQVTHYFFEGCRYYTPLLGTETEPHWRHPEWITAEAPFTPREPAASPFRRVARRIRRFFTPRTGQTSG